MTDSSVVPFYTDTVRKHQLMVAVPKSKRVIAVLCDGSACKFQDTRPGLDHDVQLWAVTQAGEPQVLTVYFEWL